MAFGVSIPPVLGFGVDIGLQRATASLTYQSSITSTRTSQTTQVAESSTASLLYHSFSPITIHSSSTQLAKPMSTTLECEDDITIILTSTESSQTLLQVAQTTLVASDCQYNIPSSLSLLTSQSSTDTQQSQTTASSIFVGPSTRLDGSSGLINSIFTSEFAASTGGTTIASRTGGSGTSISTTYLLSITPTASPQAPLVSAAAPRALSLGLWTTLGLVIVML